MLLVLTLVALSCAHQQLAWFGLKRAKGGAALGLGIALCECQRSSLALPTSASSSSANSRIDNPGVRLNALQTTRAALKKEPLPPSVSLFPHQLGDAQAHVTSAPQGDAQAHMRPASQEAQEEVLPQQSVGMDHGRKRKRRRKSASVKEEVIKQTPSRSPPPLREKSLAPCSQEDWE